MTRHKRASEKDALLQRLFTVKRYRRHFLSRVEKTGACWYWTGRITSEGYGAWQVYYEGKLYVFQAHRAMWILAGRDVPKGHVMRHKPHNVCGHRHCVRLNHLTTGSLAQNNRDKSRDGTQTGWRYRSSGSRHPMSKLTEGKVRRIKKSLRRGVTQKVIAERFGVTRGTISSINNGKTWRHVQ